METLRIVAEPGGAAAFSALLSGAYVPARGERVGVVISGGNTTAVDFDRQSEEKGPSASWAPSTAGSTYRK